MPECSIVRKESKVARNHKRDTLGFFYYTSGAEHSNLLRFNLRFSPQVTLPMCYMIVVQATSLFVMALLESLRRKIRVLRQEERGL